VGGQPKSAKNPEKTQFAMVKTPSNDAEKGPNDANPVANSSNLVAFRRETTANRPQSWRKNTHAPG